MPASRRGWLTFDVLSAVRAWKMGAVNWGFLLTVEELAGQRLPPDGFFQDMECDVAGKRRPPDSNGPRTAQKLDTESRHKHCARVIPPDDLALPAVSVTRLSSVDLLVYLY